MTSRDQRMTEPTDGTVLVLQRGQHSAGAAIGAGHADCPTFRDVFPDPRRRARALRAFFSATVRDAIPFGSVLAVWRDQLVGATGVWLPPGAFPWSTMRKAAATADLVRVFIADPGAFRTFARYGAKVERAILGSRTGTSKCSPFAPSTSDKGSAAGW